MKKKSLWRGVWCGVLWGCGVLCLVISTACTPNNPNTAPNDHHSDNTKTQKEQLSDTSTNANTNANANISTNVNSDDTDPNATIDIDWTALQTGVAPIDPDGYVYPFALDSEPVKNYAQSFHITAKQAQHSMMLAMASPEALGKVLDQIQGHYLGHSLIDGKDMQLVVYTDDRVAPSRFDYVFADKFGEGLVLPIVVTKQQTVPQVVGK